MSEADILRRIQRLGTGSVRLWRNQVGEAWVAHGNNTHVQSTPAGVRVVLEHARRVSYGIPGPGGSDLIGLRSIEITPDMIGKRMAVFTSIEVKDTGRLTKAQSNWINAINALGGYAGVAKSDKDACDILRMRDL